MSSIWKKKKKNSKDDEVESLRKVLDLVKEAEWSKKEEAVELLKKYLVDLQTDDKESGKDEDAPTEPTETTTAATITTTAKDEDTESQKDERTSDEGTAVAEQEEEETAAADHQSSDSESETESEKEKDSHEDESEGSADGGSFMAREKTEAPERRRLKESLLTTPCKVLENNSDEVSPTKFGGGVQSKKKNHPPPWKEDNCN